VAGRQALLPDHQAAGNQPGQQQPGGDHGVRPGESLSAHAATVPAVARRSRASTRRRRCVALQVAARRAAYCSSVEAEDGLLGVAGRSDDRQAIRALTGSRRARTRMLWNRSTDRPRTTSSWWRAPWDRVGGPGHGQGHEDESAQVHDPTLSSLARGPADVNWCVANSLVCLV
jgi:hypothetical protein